jgi:hypothetical protein
MKQIGVKELKSYLKQQNDEELILQIVELFQTFQQVKDFYQIRLNSDSDDEAVRKVYEEKIRKIFFPTRPSYAHDFPRYGDARKIVTAYKKVAISPSSVVKLKLFYVEMGCEFTRQYGDMYEAFYNSFESMFDSAIKEIVKYNLQDEFKIYCQDIVNLATDTGWGFYDSLDYIFQQGFNKK